MKKEAIILAAALASCSQNEDKQPLPDERTVVDTVQTERAYCASCGRLCVKSLERKLDRSNGIREKRYIL